MEESTAEYAVQELAPRPPLQAKVRVSVGAKTDLGRVREGLKSPGAADAFQTFLGFQTGEGGALAADTRARISGK